ncbi:hypothetical protein ACP70R_003418 [Stipagrostis hirtigluma subsp. patula]
MDIDDGLSIFSDDHCDDDEFEISSNADVKNDCSDDAAVDEAIFQMFKKHKIKILKRKLGSCFVADICHVKEKKVSNVKSEFCQLSRKCFADVLRELASDQIGVIERFGFGSLLKFDNCTVPKAFVQWISSCIDVRTSEILLKGRVIHFSKHSVHKILGLPIGGDLLVRDSVAGKSFLLSKFQFEKVESMEFFVEMLVGAYDMSDEEVFTCFMIIAISCFLSPDSSFQQLYEILHVFEHPAGVRNYDWSLLLYELFLAYVSKVQSRKLRPSNGHYVMNASAYILAVLYLDCLNFGSYYIPPEIPRILVWKGSVIKFCLELDEIKPGKYGRRPLKIFVDTSYTEFSSNIDEVFGQGLVLPSVITDFNAKLEALYGAVLPDELKCQDSCEQLIFKIFSFCNKLSERFKDGKSFPEDTVLNDDVPRDGDNLHGDLHLRTVDNDVQLRAENLIENLDVIPSTKSAPSTVGVVVQNDLSLKIGLSYENDKATDVSCGLNINATPNQSVFEELSVHKDLHVVPSAVLDLSTPCFLNGEKIISSAPTPLLAATPLVIPKVNQKGKGNVIKQSSLDLNKLESASAVVSENLCTPSDKVIDVDTNLPAAHNFLRSASKVLEFQFDKEVPDSSKLVFDIESQQYVRVRNNVPKEKFMSKSANFLSKLQIGDLNVPFSGTGESTPVADSVVKDLKSKSVAELHDSVFKDFTSKNAYSNGQCHVATPIEVVPVPDNGDEASNRFQQNECVPVIDVDEFHNNVRVNECVKVPCRASNDNDDVQIVREVNFQSKARAMTNQSEILYNKSLAPASKCVNVPFEGPYVCRPLPWSSKFVLTQKEKLYYIAASRLASSTKWKDQYAVDIGKCYVKYSELGNSLRTGCKVGSFVINAICRKFFLEKRPTISRKHYFFSSVGAILLNGSGSISHVKKCFDGAASVLPLHLADMLLFPICHDNHWFVFIVDFKNSLFVFLDSYYSEEDDYHIFVRSNLVPSFKNIWDELVSTPIDFEKFDIVYPKVPKQDNLIDCGVFVIMFLTFWTWYCGLCIDFSQADIDNIRIHTVSSLVCSEHNVVNTSPIRNYFGEGSFPRVGVIRKSTVNY